MTNNDDRETVTRPQGSRVFVGPGGQLDLDHVFSYHPPFGDQVQRYQLIREDGRLMAETIAAAAPPSPERSTALAKVREAVMWANAAIACNEKAPEDTDPPPPALGFQLQKLAPGLGWTTYSDVFTHAAQVEHLLERAQQQYPSDLWRIGVVGDPKDPRHVYPSLTVEQAENGWPCDDCDIRRDEHPGEGGAFTSVDHPFVGPPRGHLSGAEANQ